MHAFTSSLICFLAIKTFCFLFTGLLFPQLIRKINAQTSPLPFSNMTIPSNFEAILSFHSHSIVHTDVRWKNFNTAQDYGARTLVRSCIQVIFRTRKKLLMGFRFPHNSEEPSPYVLLDHVCSSFNILSMRKEVLSPVTQIGRLYAVGGPLKGSVGVETDSFDSQPKCRRRFEICNIFVVRPFILSHPEL